MALSPTVVIESPAYSISSGLSTARRSGRTVAMAAWPVSLRSGTATASSTGRSTSPVRTRSPSWSMPTTTSTNPTRATTRPAWPSFWRGRSVAHSCRTRFHLFTSSRKRATSTTPATWKRVVLISRCPSRTRATETSTRRQRLPARSRHWRAISQPSLTTPACSCPARCSSRPVTRQTVPELSTRYM